MMSSIDLFQDRQNFLKPVPDDSVEAQFMPRRERHVRAIVLDELADPRIPSIQCQEAPSE